MFTSISTTVLVLLGVLAGVVTRVTAEDIAQTHTKGVQIKNRGEVRLTVDMTEEDRFQLPPGQVASIILKDTWSGTISAQPTNCKADTCDGAPHTTAHIQFGGEKGKDRYYISLEEGFNLPMKIQPTGQNNFCKSSTCLEDILEHCPEDQRIKDDNGDTTACKWDVDLFRNYCPHVVITKEDPNHSNAVTCSSSNTYMVLIG